MEEKMNKKRFKTILTLTLTIIIMLTQVVTAMSAVQNLPSSTKPQQIDNISLKGPSIKAPSAIVIESRRGQILYEKSPHIKLHISTACKIMTALLAIEHEKGKLYSKVTISKECIEAGGSALSLEVGQKYTVEDLLYGILLTSANDAANALAEYVGGDINKFVSIMNNKANELNLKNTHFANPTGLFDESQYTTAYDFAMLLKYAISNPVFSKLFSTDVKTWINEDGSTKILTNQNTLFWSYDGVDGGKTGFNDKEKQTVITTATRSNQKLVCVVLDAPKESMFDDSVKILDYGFKSYKTGLLVSKGSSLKTEKISDSEVNLISINDVYYTHPVGEYYVKAINFNITKNLTLPVEKNKIIGTARYILNDDTIIDINLYPDKNISLPEDTYSKVYKKIMENKDIVILVVILLFIEAILMIYKLIKLMARLIKKSSTAEKK